MKKFLALILALVMAVSMMTMAVAEEAKAVKTGLAIVTTPSAADADKIEYDLTLVAVLVDDEGVIHDCMIDSIGAKVTLDAAGQITSDVNAAVLTKNEMGADYGMVAWGGAVAEWDAQVDALANFCVGKTMDEVKNGAVDASGKAPAGTDLAATATIYLGGYVKAIEIAATYAQHLGAKAGDEVKVASVSSLNGSKSASADANGLSELYTTVAAVSVKDGVITSCYINAVQAKVNFDAAGKIVTDLTAPVKTKNQLGKDYGMVAWGGAIAEWDQQAASFAAYVTGKTVDEVNGIAVSESGKPTDADLTASVTIGVGDFVEIINKAMK